MRPVRGVLGEGRRWGGPQSGGPSWWSWQMTLSPLQADTIPSSPRGARSMSGRGSAPVRLERGEAMDVGKGVQDFP